MSLGWVKLIISNNVCLFPNINKHWKFSASSLIDKSIQYMLLLREFEQALAIEQSQNWLSSGVMPV